MINKLRKRFIILGTVSIFVLLTILISVINIANYNAVVSDIDKTIDVLGQPNAPFFEMPNSEFQKKPNEFRIEFQKFLPKGMSVEVPYESRFFTVKLDQNGELLDKDISKIISIDNETISEYATKAFENTKEKGFIDDFRYKKISENDVTKIIFFDSGRKLEAFYSFLLISSIIGILGCLLSFLIFIVVSKRVVRPIAENYERQKRFITDAGHEIKTPLTIINANADLLETDIGSNESLDDIKDQINKLKALTNDLVYLSSVDETNISSHMDELSLTQITKDIIDEFKNLIVSKDIKLNFEIDDNVYIQGSRNKIEKLITLLIENAIKYVSENGEINIQLKNNKRLASLSVKNTFAGEYSKEELNNIFERFYRTDLSRNSETGGSGIGLSIAKAIVESHKGRIKANCSDGNFEIIVEINSIKKD